jgi:hypothetical protein
MARLTSKTLLTKYIKSQLGAPTINVEVTTNQISEIIDDTVQKFTEYAYGTLEGTILMELSGAKDYDMPDTMTNVLKLSTGGSGSNLTNFSANYGSGFVPNLWSEQWFSDSITGSLIPNVIGISTTRAILDKYFGDDLNYNFNHLNKTLQLLENFTGAAVMSYQYEYLADEQNDLVYNHEWIKAYSLAKTKFLWGTVTGKYSQTLVGGASINYSDMKQEAETSIDRLNEELLTKWSDPAPIDIA